MLITSLQLVDVTTGLQYLHDHDFVHGDLKGVRRVATKWSTLVLNCPLTG